MGSCIHGCGRLRVTVLERTNARHLTALPFAPQLVVCDVSFIGVTKALPPVLALAAPGWEALVLVKPQFEAGRTRRRRGSSATPAVHRDVLGESWRRRRGGRRCPSAS
jgi:23S rRNA (cytidine1920-2'-O)/16S rRNA (cytidine1409-2'-O)-methyltransferase